MEVTRRSWWGPPPLPETGDCQLGEKTGVVGRREQVPPTHFQDQMDSGLRKARNLHLSSTPRSRGKAYRQSVSQEKLSLELFTLVVARSFFSWSGHFCFRRKKNPEYLHTFGFYWENGNSSSRTWISVLGLS